MSIEMLYLTTCPYCKYEVGDILLKPGTIASMRRPFEESYLRIEAPDQSFFVLNSDRPVPGPCSHLIMLSGEVCKLPGENGEAPRCREGYNYDWIHPAVAHLNRDLAEIYWELVDGARRRPFTSDMPFFTERYERLWPDCGQNGDGGRQYYISGNAAFCRDAPSFFEDFVSHKPEYEAWFGEFNGLGSGLFVEGFNRNNCTGSC